jgi:glucose uptake protein GlcU
MLLGYFYAFMASLGLSLYLLPRKFSTLSPAAYTMVFGVGFFITSVLYHLGSAKSAALTSPLLFFNFLGGVLWMIGFACFTTAIDRIGLSRSSQWRNLRGPFGIILSLWLLSEHKEIDVFSTVLAAALVFFSATLFSIRKDSEKKFDMLGIYLAVIAGLMFAIHWVILRYVSTGAVEASAQQLCFSTGLVLSGILYCRVMDKKSAVVKDTLSMNRLMPLLAGAMYFATTLFQIFSVQILPSSIALTIAQLNAIWTVLIGILIFKEIDTKKHWGRISLGLIFAGISIAVLFFGMK